MWQLLFLVLRFVLSKENFLATGSGGYTTTDALIACYNESLCLPESGCCSGHGTCQASNISVSCSCGYPQACASTAPQYTGTNCSSATLGNTNVSGCCAGPTYDYTFAPSGVCNQRTAGDFPELGAKGNLARHLGSPLYADGLGSFQSWGLTISQMVANLTSARVDYNTLNNLSIEYTNFNMLGLAFLQVAIKDMVDFPLDSSNNFTIGGKTYLRLKAQANTGITWGSVDVPKRFENIATARIDLGPLYDHATRVVHGGVASPYLDLSAVSYWDTVHHMSEEFGIIMELYTQHHNNVARGFEEYYCGQNSITSGFTHSSCTTYYKASTEQGYNDWVFEETRRSTIRFSQSVLQQSSLQILLDNAITPFKGLDECFFDTWWNRDHVHERAFEIGTQGPFTKVNSHQEFVDSDNLAISGLDFLISLRNPQNYSTPTLLGDNACGFDIPPFATKIINLARTRLQKFGSPVNAIYADELELIFNRVSELGLASYNTYIAGLTNTPSGLDTDTNVYYGAQMETNATRMLGGRTPSVGVAAHAVMNDAIIEDRTGYFHGVRSETGDPDADQFHPQAITLGGFPNECFIPSGESDCSAVSAVAYQVLSGWSIADTSTALSEYAPWPMVFDKFRYSDVADVDSIYSSPPGIKVYSQPGVWGGIMLDLFYLWDGDNSMPVHMQDSYDTLLPNGIGDALPFYVGYFSPADGYCYTETVLATCDRETTNYWGDACGWWNWYGW